MPPAIHKYQLPKLRICQAAFAQFIGGDSYSGMVIPVITKKVVDGIAAKIKPHMNLKGYLMGSPHTDSIIDENSIVVTAHRMSLISDELYENYVNVDPSNAKCLSPLAIYVKCTKDLYDNNFLEPKCVYASPKPYQEDVRRSLDESPTNFILSPPKIPDFWCRNFNYTLSYMWANDVQVQDALHVRKGIVNDWQRCNMTISYTKDVESVIDVNRYLSSDSLQLLIEGGDHDMVVPLIGTLKWVKSLNLSIDDDWRPWFVDGQVAGYTRKYTKNGFRLTLATIKASKTFCRFFTFDLNTQIKELRVM